MSSLSIFGENIPHVPNDPELFKCRLTMLYGPSGSGKSSIILHILKLLQAVIPNGVVICPTNDMNKTFTGVFPDQMIHDNVNSDLLKQIFERQKWGVTMYNKINNIELLQPIFAICSSTDDVEKTNKLTTFLNDSIFTLNNKNYDKEKRKNIRNELQDKHDTKLLNIMKRVIVNNKDKLLCDVSLTDDQYVIVKNISYNPNTILILDDCASTAKDWKRFTEINKLFLEGRHYHTTTIISLQAEAALPPLLRNNAHINIFTTKEIVTTYFKKESTGVDKQMRNKIYAIAEEIFKDTKNNKKPNYKKLCWFSTLIKTDYKIQYIIGIPFKFKFGSKSYWQFCEKVKKIEDNKQTTNKINQLFG